MTRFVVFHPWKAGFTVVIGVLFGLAAFYAFQLNSALEAVAVEDFDPARARAAIGADGDTRQVARYVEPVQLEGSEAIDGEMADIRELLGDLFVPEDVNPYAFGEPIPDDEFDSYLLIGTDASGYLADVIILGLQPRRGGRPILVSLPRDLYVWNPCKKTFTRLNAGLGGCSGVASGMEMMAILVEDYTGIPVDHMARTTFSGFERIIDVMGGVQVCVDAPTRDIRAHLEILEEGCLQADGATALAWVRSRHPEQLVDGEWVTVKGSDYTRQGHQQDVLFQLAGKAARFSSPASLADKLSVITSSLRLDSGWSLGSAVSAAWDYRGITKSEVARFSISARNYRTPGGSAVLVPTEYFKDQLSAVYSFG